MRDFILFRSLTPKGAPKTPEDPVAGFWMKIASKKLESVGKEKNDGTISSPEHREDFSREK